MNNIVENDFFGFPEVKLLHLTGEVDESAVRYSRQIFSGFNVPKNHHNRLILTELFTKAKVGRVFGARCRFVSACCGNELCSQLMACRRPTSAVCNAH